MAATKLTKKAVLEEIQELRKKIREYSSLDSISLKLEYQRAFPAAAEAQKSDRAMLASLLIAATYYLTNVLNLE